MFDRFSRWYSVHERFRDAVGPRRIQLITATGAAAFATATLLAEWCALDEGVRQRETLQRITHRMHARAVKASSQ